MPIPRSTRTLLATATIALMAGCSGTSQLAPTVGGQNVPQTQQSASQSVVLSPGEDLALQLKKVTKTPMVFVSDAGNQSKSGGVYGYLQSGTNQAPSVTIPAGGANALVTPYGEFFDKTGNLYVTDIGAKVIQEYAWGQTMPLATFHDNGQQPGSIAVCPNKNVYVVDISGSIEVYTGGSHVPSYTIIKGGSPAGASGVACDKSSNFYVGYLDAYAGPSEIDEYAAGSKGNPTILPAQQIVQIGDVALTKAGDIVVTEQNPANPEIQFYHLTSTKPYKVLSKMFTPGVSIPYELAYSNGYTHLYVVDGGKNDVLELNPGTGAVIDTITKPGYYGAIGVAAFPPGHV